MTLDEYRSDLLKLLKETKGEMTVESGASVDLMEAIWVDGHSQILRGFSV